MYRVGAGIVLTLVALMAPTAAHAAVVISEVAWMGTAASANAEWIELQNTDSGVVNLSGWTLVSSTGSPSITLTGSITGNGFYLLERTSDTSVPDIAADQIYSGALSNSGVTLTLKDGTGTVIDTVAGGTDWKTIGGDNTTKATPQRNGSTWVTATPTPRALNNSSSSSGDTGAGNASTTEDTTTPQTSVGGSPIVPTANFSSPIPRLRITAGPARIVAAGARVPYSAHVYDEYGTVRSGAHFTWSFGDGTTAEGREVEHAYLVPGTYLVMVHASDGPSATSLTLTVRADAVQAVIERVDEQGVTIRNDGTGVLDLSSWKLVRDGTSFTFPLYTALLPKSTVTFPYGVTGLGTSTTQVTLQFPDGATVATGTPERMGSGSTEVVPDVIKESVPVLQPTVLGASISRVEEAPPQIDTNGTQVHEEATTAPSAPVDPGVLGASSPLTGSLLKSPWTASFFGLVLAAGAALVLL